MPLSQLTGTGDTGAVTKINAAIVEADRVDGLATRMTSAETSIISEQTTREARDVEERNNRIAAVNNEAQLRQAGDVNEALAREARDQFFAAQSVARDTALDTRLSAAIASGDAAQAAALAAAEARLGRDIRATPGHAGEGRQATLSPLDWHPSRVVPLSEADQVVTQADGAVARIRGTGQIAPLVPFKVAPGHDYQVRFAFRRAFDPVAPGVNAIRLALRWLDGTGAQIGQQLLDDVYSFTTASGRADVTFRFSLWGGVNDDVPAPPAGTVLVWPYLTTSGGGELLVDHPGWVTDVSDGVDYAPDLSGMREAVFALDAQVQGAVAGLAGIDDELAKARDASNITMGTLDDARLSERIARLNAAGTFTVAQSFADELYIGHPNAGDGKRLRLRKDGNRFSIDPPAVSGTTQQTDNSVWIAPTDDNRWIVDQDIEVRGEIVLPNPAPTRANLQVYSTGETDAEIAGAIVDGALLRPGGTIDCSANPNYPAALAGQLYLVTAAGRIGGGSGPIVDAGDVLWCRQDSTNSNHATVGSRWTILQANIVNALTTAGGTLVGALTLAFNGAVPAGATTDLSAVAANLVALSGSATTISSLGPATIGQWKLVYMNAAHTLVHSATLSLPGSANIVAGVADWALFVTNGAGWLCAIYQRKSGKPLIASTAAEVPFTPTGTLAATTVQAAIAELLGETVPSSYLDTDGGLTANSDTRVATQKATKTYVDQIVAAQDAMVFKGVVDCSTNPNYPAADCGWTYRVSVAGKIGGASGINVEIGDFLICRVDATAAGNQATVGANWSVIQANIDGGLTVADIGVTLQAYDADLAALAALATTGLIGRTGAGTVAARTITGTAAQIAVANGDGVSGNPTVSFPSTVNFSGISLQNIPGFNSLFEKADRFSAAFTKTGAGTISVKAGTLAAVAGIVVPFLVDTAVTMPSLTAGTDYAIYVCTDGTIRADASFSAPTGYTTANSRQIGGFHYAPGGNATGVAGGNTTPQINEYSIWDLAWRPACADPRGMTLVANTLWVDIYLLGVDHHTNGTSRNNVTIADSGSAPKVAAAFGGDGTATVALSWLAANEIYGAYGKRLLTLAEFAMAAYGTTEQAARGSDPVTTGLGTSNAGSTNTDEKFTSKWGVIQATGCQHIFGGQLITSIAGADYTAASTFSYKAVTGSRGNIWAQGTNGLNVPVFGGDHSVGANAGSRAANFSFQVNSTSASVGARGCAAHVRA